MSALMGTTRCCGVVLGRLLIALIHFASSCCRHGGSLLRPDKSREGWSPRVLARFQSPQKRLNANRCCGPFLTWAPVFGPGPDYIGRGSCRFFCRPAEGLLHSAMPDCAPCLLVASCLAAIWRDSKQASFIAACVLLATGRLSLLWPWNVAAGSKERSLPRPRRWPELSRRNPLRHI